MELVLAVFCFHKSLFFMVDIFLLTFFAAIHLVSDERVSYEFKAFLKGAASYSQDLDFHD